MTSVKTFALWYKKTINTLDYLINNAGINYINTPIDYLKNVNISTNTNDGIDLAFATNYMGHFLLTELLLPNLKKRSSSSSSSSSSANIARIINVASTFHGQVDGSYLKPSTSITSDSNNNDDINRYPLAARGDIFSKRSSDIYHQRSIAYGNNKLAQLLHAKELQRILNNDTNTNTRRVEIISTCPGFTSTNIFKDDLLGNFIRSRAFNAKAGALAPICSMFASELKGSEFVTNFYNFWASQSYSSSLFTFLR